MLLRRLWVLRSVIGVLVLWMITACTGVPAEPQVPLPTAVPAPAIRETIAFESLTLPGTLWSPLLPPIGDGTPVTISGLLAIPAGNAPLPAVVLAHGCSGIAASHFAWAKHLNDLGIATLIVQSFAGRNITELCSGRGNLNIASVLVDAYRALDLLAAHPRIDPERIAILGFSFGGRTALWTSQVRVHTLYGTPGRTFAAHLAFYPTGCYIQLSGEEQVTGAPIRIFHGSADDWTPIAQCAAYVDRLRAADQDVVLFAYADALHSFDNGYTTGKNRISEAASPKNCTFVERDGILIDVATGVEASVSSSCVVRGVTVGYQAAAHEQSIRDLEAVLGSAFQLPVR